MAELQIGGFRESDLEATARLFFLSVHLGAKEYYSEAQRRAWAPKVPETSVWAARLSQQTVFVAEEKGGVVGFMTLKPDGCIDLAFIAPSQLRRGITRKLYKAIMREANKRGIKKLYAEASYPAHGFLIAQGWSVIEKQTVNRGEVTLTNFLMAYLTQPARTL